MKTGDGSNVPIYLSVSCVLMENQPIFCLSITDLTDQKRNERILSEERLSRSIIDQSTDALIVCDDKGKVIRASQAAFHLIGRNCLYEYFDESFPLQLKPLPGKSSEDAQDIESFRIADVIAGRIYHSREAFITCEGMPENHLLLSAAPLMDKNNEAVGGLINLADITEHHQIKKQMADLLDYIRTIFEKSPIGIATIKATGQVITVNPALAEIVGGTVERIIHVNVHDIAVWQDSGLLSAAQEVLRTGIEKSTEFHYFSSFGKECWVSCLFTPFMHEGEQQLLLMMADISERKQAEQEREKLQTQLNQSQKMESVGRLAGGVAHDFNNMLGIILGHTEMVMDDMNPAHPLHGDLEEIRKTANRSAALTRQLLAFARKQTIAPKVLDLNETIESMFNMLRRLVSENIGLAWLPGAHAWPVRMDPTQIDQILVNLCVNARDAITNGGRITIETGTASFDEAYCADHAGYLPGDYVLLAVSDDGSGMTPETLKNLFEPFFTTKEINKGTGLGLATVYGIVQQNNGFINVYSEPQQGTTFRIYLPRHEDNAAPPHQIEPVPADKRGNETILLVEDEPAILKMTTIMLQRLGYTVLGANTPGEAIRLAHEYSGDIHLLMTDVIMPEMNGRELAADIQFHYPRIKRLFMSGYTADMISHQGILGEGVNFIQKPFSKKELAAKMRESLTEKI
jgi:PAS domain S-box-containing protein